MKASKNTLSANRNIRIANQLILNHRRYLNYNNYKRRTNNYKIKNHQCKGLTEYLRKNSKSVRTFIIIPLMEQLGKVRQKNQQNMHIVMIIL